MSQLFLILLNITKINQFQMKKLIMQVFLTLNLLSKKYKLDDITNRTENYILQNINDFIIYKILDPQTLEIEKIKYEKILSNNLLAHINDKELIKVPFATLNNIFSNYLLENENHEEVIEFLFKCLVNYPQIGSILFNRINLNNINPEHISRLKEKEHEAIFIPSLLDSSFLTTYKEKSNSLDDHNNDDENDNSVNHENQSNRQIFSNLQGLNNQENNNKLQNTMRFLCDVQVKHYFEDFNNVESFNKLNGDAQTYIFSEILNISDKQFCNIKNMLIYLSKENEKAKYKFKNSNYISIYTNQMKSSLMNIGQIDCIEISANSILM